MDKTSTNLPVPRAAVRDLHPYEAGKPLDEIAREYDLDERPVKLASNENPYSPPEELKEVYSEEFETLNRYPDGGVYHLRKKLSDRYDWPIEGIVIGAGSDEVTDFLARAYLDPNDEVIVGDPSFVRHSMLPKMMGATPVSVPVTDEFDLDLDAMRDVISDRTKWICLPNPNNPTSRYLGRNSVEAFLGELPSDLTVIYDEAYYEFMNQDDYPDGRKLLDRFNSENDPTIILQRTFSKAYALAGLRVGYALMPPAVAEELHKVRPPFNVTRPAQAVAAASLNCGTFLEDSLRKIEAERDRLTAELESRGFNFVPPSANFLLLELPQAIDSEEFCEALRKEGVIVRSMKPYGLEQHVRVSVGRPDENDRFLSKLDLILG